MPPLAPPESPAASLGACLGPQPDSGMPRRDDWTINERARFRQSMKERGFERFRIIRSEMAKRRPRRAPTRRVDSDNDSDNDLDNDSDFPRNRLG